MIVYVYKDGLCDPLKDIGTARQFDNSKDVDEYISMWAASMQPKVIDKGKYRIFICDNNTTFDHVDHHINFNGEAMQTDMFRPSIEEVNIPQLALAVNSAYKERETARSVQREQKMKRLKDARERG